MDLENKDLHGSKWYLSHLHGILYCNHCSSHAAEITFLLHYFHSTLQVILSMY